MSDYFRNIFQELLSKEDFDIKPLAISSGSNRKYFRIIQNDKSYIGVYNNTLIEENKAFINLSEHFYKKGLPVPEIYKISSDFSAYLQEDLGNISLFDFIRNGSETGLFSEEEIKLLKKTISLLPSFQYKGAQGLDFSMCYPLAEFDERSILWDLNYFKYCFLKLSGLEFREDFLEDDFNRLLKILLKHRSNTFMYRDFQSRNIMLASGEPFFIDYQGGRRGPVYYDVASFIWQAKANYPDEIRRELLDEYLNALLEFEPELDKTSFEDQLKYFVLFRLFQVLGAYGFRGYMEKKSHFIESIPYAIDNLRKLIIQGFDELPYLSDVLNRMVSKEQFKFPVKSAGLLIKITSFSYKKGIPDDFSGNGGGYVFDCRAIHNPGRYDIYKELTGLDQPVIDFLEKEGEMILFMNNVKELAEKHIESYLQRNFTHLMFSFGCTGGQHRSVYAAQALADFLASKYPVDILLEHREQGIKRMIK